MKNTVRNHFNLIEHKMICSAHKCVQCGKSEKKLLKKFKVKFKVYEITCIYYSRAFFRFVNFAKRKV